MVDAKIFTLLTLVKVGSYTKAAQELHLSQPAVTHHIQMLEKEYGVKLFQHGKKELVPTPEGDILIKYARRLVAVYDSAKQAIEDSRRQAKHLTIGITQTAGESLMTRVLALYCNEHPNTHINIRTDTIKKLYKRLELYELDIAVMEGILPGSAFCSLVLDTDHLCLIVSPEHRFARRQSVRLNELKSEKLILRPSSADTRKLFETCLQTHMETLNNFNVIMELDNISMIKDLVSLDLGVSIMAHSGCIEDVRQGKLMIVPIEDVTMMREIHMVYNKDFSHTEILDDFKRIYNSLY